MADFGLPYQQLPAGNLENIPVLYADLDLARIPAEHLTFDAVGHYGRPDIFTLTVNTTPQTYLDAEDERSQSTGTG